MGIFVLLSYGYSYNSVSNRPICLFCDNLHLMLSSEIPIYYHNLYWENLYLNANIGEGAIMACLSRLQNSTYRVACPRKQGCPANTVCWSNIGLLLGQRRKWWPNRRPILDQQDWISIPCFQNVRPYRYYIIEGTLLAMINCLHIIQARLLIAAAAICLSCYMPKTMWMYNV